MELAGSKEKIIQVARRVFGKLGFNKTTMTDIATAAKRGRRTIYTHFKSKEDVYEAVIQSEIESLSRDLAESIKEDVDDKIRLKHYIIRRMISIRDLLNYHDALKNAFFEDYERFVQIRKNLDKQEENFLREILTHGIEKGSLKPLNVDLTIHNIMITIKAFELPYFKENYTKDQEKQLNNIIDILLYGISANESNQIN